MLTDRDIKAIKLRVESAEVICAEMHGGRRDGEFVPLWISQDAASRIAASTDAGETDSIRARIVGFVISDEETLEAMRKIIAKEKGTSAMWPEGVRLEYGKQRKKRP